VNALQDGQRRAVFDLQRSLEDSGRFDQVVDVWRTLAQEARHALLALRRDELLEVYEVLLRHWLYDFLQRKQIDPAGVTANIEGVFRSSGAPLVSIADTSLHPARWRLDHRLAVSLESIVNPRGGKIRLHGVVAALLRKPCAIGVLIPCVVFRQCLRLCLICIVCEVMLLHCRRAAPQNLPYGTVDF
jgi:hypothetical protein